MEFNRETIRKIRGLIVFTVAAAVAGVNYSRLWRLAGEFFHMVWPFLLGGVIAFVLNVPMRQIEKHMKVLKEDSRLKRPVCLIITLLLVSGVLFLVFFVVAPELVRTVMSLQNSIPPFLTGVKKQLEELFASYPEISDYVSAVEVDWKELLRNTMDFLKRGAGSMLNTTFTAAASIVSAVSTFVIGFIFSVYILLQKEKLSCQLKKLLYAFLPEPAVKRILDVGSLTERTFSSFLAGQCLEAVILGAMFFVTLTVMGLPYALLIGVCIAFTALIPVFGAFIGLGVGVFLMLMADPMDALLFTIVFFVLQQIEGNLIYPHVVGGSVGLPSIWVLAAVTLGGSMMGVAGMLVFIPMCSVFYSLLRDTVNMRLAKKADREADQTEGEESK